MTADCLGLANVVAWHHRNGFDIEENQMPFDGADQGQGRITKGKVMMWAVVTCALLTPGKPQAQSRSMIRAPEFPVGLH